MQSLTSVADKRLGRPWAPRHSLLPGLFLTSTTAAVAFELRNLSGLTILSPLIIAIVLYAKGESAAETGGPKDG